MDIRAGDSIQGGGDGIERVYPTTVWPPSATLTVSQGFRRPFVIIHVLLSVVIAFGFCFAFTYPVLPPEGGWTVFSSMTSTFVIGIPMGTPVSIAMLQPVITYAWYARDGIDFAVSDADLSRLCPWKLIFPLVTHPNQLLSSLVYGLVLTVETAWIVFLAMYTVYGSDTGLSLMALSLWSSVYCALLAVPSALYVIFASTCETACALYTVSLWRVYVGCSPAEKIEDPLRAMGQESRLVRYRRKQRSKKQLDEQLRCPVLTGSLAGYQTISTV